MPDPEVRFAPETLGAIKALHGLVCPFCRIRIPEAKRAGQDLTCSRCGARGRAVLLTDDGEVRWDEMRDRAKRGEEFDE